MENSIEPITLYTFVNDTAPNLHFVVNRQHEGVVDLSGATVDFLIQNPYNKTRTNNEHSACHIDDGEAGKCTYTWQEGDIPVEGIYDANLRITYADGQVETAKVNLEVSATV